MTDTRDQQREAAIEYLRSHRITPEVRAADGRRQRIMAVVGGVAVAALAAAVTAGLLAIPEDQGDSEAVAPTVATSIAPVPTQTVDAIPLADMHIVQGVQDLIASPRDINEVPGIAVPDEGVEATLITVRPDGREAIGVLTDAGNVCLYVYDFPVQEGRTICTAYVDFLGNGVVVDRGAWDVHWWADGSIVWNGLE